MRISIGRKVSLTLKAIVAATVVAIVATYFVSANAIRAIRASQQASQAMLAASADMEADVVFGGLRLFQYLESRDPYYLDAYREHSRHFQRDAEHLLAHNDFAAGREAVRQVAEQYRALDQVSRDVISNHDRMNREIEAVLKHLPRLRAASAALVEGTPVGSPQYALGKKIETTRTQMFDALLDFIYRDRGDGSVAARLADLRGLLEDYDKLALAAAHKTLVAELTAALQALSAALNEALQSSQAKRDQMTKMLLQQRQIISAIHTRVNPALKLHAQETDRKADTRMQQVLYAAGAIALLLALLAILTGRYLRRAIVTPIQALAHGANRVAGGHLDHRVVITTDDEYADLANNFNHMVGQLQGSMVSRAQHEAQASQLRALLDGVHDYAIFSVDEQGYVTNWNTASTHILGYAAQDMEGVSFARIFKDSEQARTVRDEALAGIAASGRFETNSSVIRAGGEAFEANIVVTPLRADDGALKGYTVVVCDITERLKAERHIERLATTDTLTGLANRNMLLQQLNAAVARAARSRMQLAMMFIDLDNFKTVNDTLGHAAGDDLLRECAKRLTQCVRQGDVVARLGGDEFVVLLTDVTAGSIVTPVADRMLKLLAQPYQLHGQETQTTASIGICFYPADGEDATMLMKNADIAMYHAKEQNRNNYQFYAEEMNQRMLQRTQLERELRAALENHEFVLHYQPQVAIESGKIRGVESLIRWQHPQRGLLSPDKFIPVAEETGLIVPIGDWVLDHVCLTIKAWRANGVDIPYIGVNVSAVQLNQDLVASVRQALVTHGIAPGWLMLEITETMLMERVDEAIAILRRIRELGVRIAMDDFGTGYSSLSVLQRLPLDVLKIDRSFVRAIDDEKDNTRAVAIISAMIAIAKELDLTVVAEGVETPTQLAFLRTLNCDTYQGYLFSKPVDTMSLQARFAAPAKSVLEDENGRAITLTTKVTVELNNGAGS